jgi:nickel/cobalt exporter
MAIAALSIDGRTERRHQRVMMTAVQFACGHALMLGVGVLLALTGGWILPAAFVSSAERVGGAVLVFLGAAGFWSTWTGRAYGHLHRETDGRARWHMHFGRHTHTHGSHAHSALPVTMGAVFAISSLRALVLLAPMGTSLTSLAVPVVLLLVVLFGLGILLSMSLFGVVLARLISLQRLEIVGRWAGVIVAAASVLLGAYWMV